MYTREVIESLFGQLSDPDAQLERLMIRINMPEVHRPGPGSPFARTNKILQWAEGHGGCGLRKLRDELQKLVDEQTGHLPGAPTEVARVPNSAESSGESPSRGGLLGVVGTVASVLGLILNIVMLVGFEWFRYFFMGMTSFVLALASLVAAIALLVWAIRKLIEELNFMKLRGQKNVGKLVRRRSFLLPLVLVIVLAGLTSTIFVGRAAVSDTGKPIGNVSTFPVDIKFAPTGKMGDVGDITTIHKEESFVRFVYEAKGRGPHEWDQKYVKGKENQAPAKFGGVMYLNPANNWGSDPDGGYDLRSCRRVIKWEARSVDGPVNVDFLLGGISWDWDPKTNQRVKVQYPDTLEQSLGTRSLTGDWRPFEVSLSDLGEEYFKRVVGGFGWIVNWDSNGVVPNENSTGALRPRTFTIEIRNIRFEK